MKEKRTGKPAVKDRTDWKRLRSLSDRQIRSAIDSDAEAQPTYAEFWKKARVVIPKAKRTITIRLDVDLLEWLRKEKGYQTRINALLRTYMDASLTSGRD
jgi:uncharacterized protein (DUF4415 family)